jgi:hypothetical protein
MTKSCRGICFCGAVAFEVSGDPEAMGYCHCASCRHWSAGPVNAFSLWKPGAVRVVKGEDCIATFKKSERSHRKWCRLCGGHLFVVHPDWDLIDVFAATIPGLQFRPALHVNYQDHVLRIADGLPKLLDFPKDLGGTGEMAAE